MNTAKELATKFKKADHDYQLAYGAYMIDGDYNKLRAVKSRRDRAFKAYAKAKKVEMKF